MKRFITKCCPASGIYNFNVGNPVVGSIKLRRNIEAYLPIDETLCARRFDRCEYLTSILCCHLHKTTFLEHIINYTRAYSKPRGFFKTHFNPLKPELYPICYLLALLAHHFLHVSRIRVKSLTFRRLMSYIYIYIEHPFLMFLDHTQRRSTVGRTPLDE